MSKIIKLTEKQLDDIHSLREYLNTTSQFPDLFRAIVGQNISYKIGDMLKYRGFLPHGASLLFFWLGLLNCVVEGWFELGLKDKKINNLIGCSRNNMSKNTIELQRFRNRVFHFQKKKKPLHADFIYKPDLLEWAMTLNFEFEKWFDYYFTANSLPRSDPHYEWFQNPNEIRDC